MKSLRQLQQQLEKSGMSWMNPALATEQCCHCLGTGTLPAAQYYLTSRPPRSGRPGGSATSSAAPASSAPLSTAASAASQSSTGATLLAQSSAAFQQQQQRSQLAQWQALQNGPLQYGSAPFSAPALSSHSAYRSSPSAWYQIPGLTSMLTIVTGSTALVGCGYCIGNASANSGQALESNTIGRSESDRDLGMPSRATLPRSLTRKAMNASTLSPFFIADAAAKASPAVVNIKVRHVGQTADSSANGSGFIITSEGLVVTNAHTVSEAISVSDGGKGGGPGSAPADAVIAVTLQGGRCLSAQLLNFDWESDLAVLRVTPLNGLQLPVATLGRSDDLRAGEWVVALGSPLHLANSVSAGIVSAVRRRGVDLGLAPGTDFIQTDAACNVGSSGGPLVNVQGEVIGISTLKAHEADGVSFAIPIDSARLIIDQLIGSKERPDLAHLGAKALQLSPAAAAVLAAEAGGPFAAEQPPGLYVSFVEAGGPAERGGLRAGDTIIGWPGHSGLTTSALEEAVRRHVSQPLILSVVRNTGGPAETVTVQPVLRKQ